MTSARLPFLVELVVLCFFELICSRSSLVQFRNVGEIRSVSKSRTGVFLAWYIIAHIYNGYYKNEIVDIIPVKD